MDEIASTLFGKMHIIGLRYFNVFGPREAYKGRPASMIYHLGKQVRSGKKPRLFKRKTRKSRFLKTKRRKRGKRKTRVVKKVKIKSKKTKAKIARKPKKSKTPQPKRELVKEGSRPPKEEVKTVSPSGPPETRVRKNALQIKKESEEAEKELERVSTRFGRPSGSAWGDSDRKRFVPQGPIAQTWSGLTRRGGQAPLQDRDPRPARGGAAIHTDSITRRAIAGYGPGSGSPASGAASGTAQTGGDFAPRDPQAPGWAAPGRLDEPG